MFFAASQCIQSRSFTPLALRVGDDFLEIESFDAPGDVGAFAGAMRPTGKVVHPIERVVRHTVLSAEIDINLAVSVLSPNLNGAFDS